MHALRDVSLRITRGEIHALCGENGAGKSTLIKILSGVTQPTSGTILVDGRALVTGNVQACENMGIAVMHQESTAFPDLNSIDNLFVGREIKRGGGLLLDRKEMRRLTLRSLQRLGEQIDVDIPVGRLPVAQRQMVAMARSLSRNCRLLIMDEPTASLSARETEVLLNIIGQLRDDGVSVLYVSHRLEEVFQISDRVTVLRDGQVVETCRTANIDRDGLIKRMVGREVNELTRRSEHAGSRGQAVLLKVESLCGSAFADITFEVRAGEIVGLGGLVGAGRSQVARAIFGIDQYQAGRILVNGESVAAGSVQSAMMAGLALVPEDRQHDGLVLPMSVGANVSLAILDTLKCRGLINRHAEQRLVDQQLRNLQVKSAGPGAAAETLSGGNQQKLVLAKWLAGKPRVLILDEPTRGVDVGSKAQVHRLIRQLAADGIATLLISSELTELLSMSDRILVMREGRISGELDGATTTQERILELAIPAEIHPVGS